jgi:hypothetical protein
MLTKRNRKEDDWKLPRIWRAAIYLREPASDSREAAHREPSISEQHLICRCVATVLHAEVVGEFVDERSSWPSRPGLRGVLERAGEEPRLDFLIVSSLERLVCDFDEAFEVAWRLGFAGTVWIPADAEGEFPWTGKTPS